MPYIGRDLNRGNYLKLDDISSSFNSSTKTFNLTVGGSAFTPGSAFSILVSVGGVIQEPESAYQVNNSEITFANAPTAQDGFFCIALGVSLGIGVPGNGTVNGPQIAKPFNYDGFFYLNDASNRVGINSSIPTSALDVSGTIKASTFSGPVVGNTNNTSGISTFYDLRVSNNLTVEGTTTTLDTNLLGVDRVEVGANSNSIVGVAVTQSGTADLVNLFDGATKVVTIDDQGNVGLGSENPSAKLDVNGDAKLQGVSIAGVTTVANDTQFIIGSNATATRPLKISHTSSSTRNQFTSDYIDFNVQDARFRNISNNAQIAQFWTNQVNLFASGTQRFSTTSSGANVYGNLQIESTGPYLILKDTDHNNDFAIHCNNGSLQFVDTTDSYTSRMNINSSGNVSIAKNLDVDGQTDLDNVSIAGVTTFSDRAYLTHDLTITGTAPRVIFTDTDNNPDYRINVDGGSFSIQDTTNGNANRFVINNVGNVTIPGNFDVIGNIAGFGDLTLTDTATDSAAGPEFKLFRNSASPADADYLGQIKFAGESDTGVERNYAKITGKILDASNGTEDGILEFAHIKAGSQTITGRWRSDSLQLLNGTSLTVAGTLDVTGVITGENHVKVTDSGRLLLGTGSDFQLFHNGSGSFIDAYTNNLQIRNDGTELIAEFKRNLSVDLYYDGTKRFETKTNGAQVNGSTLFIRGGTGEDSVLQFISNNSASYDDHYNFRVAATGAFALETEVSANNYENLLTATRNGAVRLFYDNSQKMLTSSTGINVDFRISASGDENTYVNLGSPADQWQFYTGGVDRLFITGGPSDGGTVQVRGDNNKLQIGASQDLQLYHDGSDSYIKEAGTGNLIISSEVVWLKNSAQNETTARFIQDGAAELYHNSSKKFETTSSGGTLTGSLTVTDDIFLSDANVAYFGTNNDMRIYHSGTHGYVKNTVGNLYFMTTNSEYGALLYANGAAELRYDNVKKFETTSSGSKTTGMHLISGESNIDNQGSPLLYLQSTANTNVKAVFLLEDDYTTGRAALAINVGESGVTNDRDLMLQKAGGKVGIRCTPTTSFEVSGSSKFNGSIDITGELNLTGNGAKYFDVDTLTNSNSLTLRHRSDTNTYETAATFVANGGATFTHNGSTRLATTSSGVSVTGLLVADGGGTQTTTLQLKNGTDTDGTKIGHSSNSNGGFIQVTESGAGFSMQVGGPHTSNLRFQCLENYGNTQLVFGTEKALVAIPNGAVELYHNDTKRLETTGNGLRTNGELIYMGPNNTVNYVHSGGSVAYTADTNIYFVADCNDTSGDAPSGEFRWGGGSNTNTDSNQDFTNAEFGNNGQPRNQYLILDENSLRPASNGGLDLGTSSLRFDNIFTQDLNLSNEGSTNDVDGTWGSYTIQEGEDDLFLINKRSGKKYKFNLTEVS